MDESEKQSRTKKSEKLSHQTTELHEETEYVTDDSNKINFEIIEDKKKSNYFSIKLHGKCKYKKYIIFLKKVTKEEEDQLCEPRNCTEGELSDHKDYIIKKITNVNTDIVEKDILSDIDIKPSTKYAVFICGDDCHFSKCHFINTHGHPKVRPIFILSVVVLLIAAFLFIKNDGHSYRSIEEFKVKMEKMKLDFPNQDEVLWKILTNGGIRHLRKVHDENKHELAPLSYLVAGYANTSDTMDCFLSRLSKAYTTDAEEQMIDSRKFVNYRGKLDKKIKDSLRGKRKFLIVKDIEHLEFSVAQLFMSYSDEHNTVASYPQSILILTTELPFSAQSRHSDEAKVARYFKDEVWSGIHADFAAPLWSRVGDGLVLLKNEEKNPCSLAL